MDARGRDDASGGAYEVGVAMDASEDMDVAADTEMGANEPPEVWDGVTNRCATARPLPAATSWGEERARPEQVVASIAWGRTSPCEGMGTPTLEGVDQVGDHGSMVLARRGGEEVVAVTHEFTSAPEWSGNGVKALAWIEPEGGTPIGCDVFEDGRGVVFTPMHPSPWAPEDVIVATTTNQNDFTSGLRGDPPTTRWWAPGWPDDVGRELPDPVSGSGFLTPRTRLLPDGQLLLFPRADRLVSVDAVTGELNWVVRPGEIRALISAELGEEYDGFLRMRRQYTRFDRDRRVVRTRVASSRSMLGGSLYLEIDACGSASLVEAPPGDQDATWWDIPFGQGTLEVSFNGNTYQARVRDADQTLGTMTECLQIVTLTEDTAGCMRTSKFGAAFELEKLTWPARKGIVRLDESNSQEAERIWFKDAMVALTGDVLLLSAMYIDANEDRERLIFMDWRSGEVLTHVEFTPPPDAVVNEIAGPPLVTSDGMIVVQKGGYLTGISTNTGGLSPTSFPRGVDLGRNDNLGIWTP
jgi:hypothetical protein